MSIENSNNVALFILILSSKYDNIILFKRYFSIETAQENSIRQRTSDNFQRNENNLKSDERNGVSIKIYDFVQFSIERI